MDRKYLFLALIVVLIAALLHSGTISITGFAAKDTSDVSTGLVETTLEQQTPTSLSSSSSEQEESQLEVASTDTSNGVTLVVTFTLPSDKKHSCSNGVCISISHSVDENLTSSCSNGVCVDVSFELHENLTTSCSNGVCMDLNFSTPSELTASCSNGVCIEISADPQENSTTSCSSGVCVDVSFSSVNDSLFACSSGVCMGLSVETPENLTTSCSSGVCVDVSFDLGENLTTSCSSGVCVDVSFSSVNDGLFACSSGVCMGLSVETPENLTTSCSNGVCISINTSISDDLTTSCSNGVCIDMTFGSDQGSLGCGSAISSDSNITFNFSCSTEVAFAIIGDDVEVDCNGNAVTGNGAANSTGFLINGASNVILNNCGIENVSKAFNIIGGSSISINNVVIEDEIFISTDSSAQFNNLLINQTQGSIQTTFDVNTSTEFNTTNNLNISNNYIFVNSTNLPDLNVPANITLTGVTDFAFTPELKIDSNNDGSFETCNDCYILSYANGIFRASVQHFTGYSAFNSTPVLTSTSGSNAFYDDLNLNFTLNGSYYKSVTNWIVDSSSIYHVLMPFESTFPGEDYSNNSYVGVFYGTGFNPTAGYDGNGSIEFDGVDDYTIIENSDQIVYGDEFAISFWAKTDLNDNPEKMIDGRDSSTAGFEVGLGGSGFTDCGSSVEFCIIFDEGTSKKTLKSTTTPVEDGDWHFIAGSVNSTGSYMWVDGILEDSDTGLTPMGAIDANITIGASETLDELFFNGSIDDLRIYNKSLTQEQVIILNNSNNKLVDSSSTSLGETWQACVTPINDSQDGITQCSNTLTITTGCVNLTNSDTYVGRVSVSGSHYDIHSSFDMCQGSYDLGGFGLRTQNPNLEVDCSGAYLTGTVARSGFDTNNDDNVTIRNCIFDGFLNSIDADSKQVYIYNNTLKGALTAGIEFSNSGTVDGAIVEGNRIYNTTDGIILSTGGSTTNLLVSNNVFENISGIAVNLLDNSAQYNNVTFNNITNVSIGIVAGNDFNIVRNNMIFNSDVAIQATASPGAPNDNSFSFNHIQNTGVGYQLLGGTNNDINITDSLIINSTEIAVDAGVCKDCIIKNVSVYSTNATALKLDNNADRTQIINFTTYGNATYFQIVGNSNDLNATNFKICADTDSTCVNWDFVSILGMDYSITNGTNIYISEGFMSLDSLNVPDFNESAANVSIAAGGCVDLLVFNSTGFETSRDSIYSIGNKFVPNDLSCLGGVATFGVSSFSSYAAGGGCVNLSDSSTYHTRVTDSSGTYSLNDNVTLCPGTYETTQDLIKMGANNIRLDCQGALLRDTGSSFGVEAIDFEARLNDVAQNCEIESFTSAIVASGTNAQISNITFRAPRDRALDITGSNVQVENSSIYNSEITGINVRFASNPSLDNIFIINSTGTALDILTTSDGIYSNIFIDDSNGGVSLNGVTDSNFSNITILNSLSQAILSVNGGFNTIFNNTLIRNAQTGMNYSFPPVFGQEFYNTMIINVTTYIDTLTSDVPDLDNFTICGKEGKGCIEWSFNGNDPAVLDSSNVILNSTVAIIDSGDSDTIEFSFAPATITFEVDDCNSLYYYKSLVNFPTTIAEIVSQEPFAPTTSSCTNNITTFDVSSFSGYTTLSTNRTSFMNIFDSTDAQGGSQIIFATNNSLFFANYTNSTDSIVGATCLINFTDSTNNALSYNATSKYYEYVRSFSSSGLNNYNISCTQTNYHSKLSLSNISIPNQEPFHNIPVLISTSPDNKSTGNLTLLNQSTIDYEGDVVKNIVDWRVDNSSIVVLNMPFETSSSNSTFTKDFSTNSLNGTVSTSTHLPAGGFDGFGAYNFSSDHISVGTESTFNFIHQTAKFTATAWIKLDNPDNSLQNGILGSSGDGLDNGIFFTFDDVFGAGDRTLLCIVSTGSAPNIYLAQTINQVIIDTNWHHVVCVVDGIDAKIYVDGVEQSLAASQQGAPGTGDASFILNVGRINKSSPGQNFQGLIDEVMIFNRSLSSEQINLIYENRTNIISSQDIGPNQNWTGCITPIDYELEGEEKCSQIIKIQNTPPVITNVIVNATDNPDNFTDADLNCYNGSVSDVDGDTSFSYTYRWFKNGAFEQTGQTVLNTSTTIGENWICELTAHDGFDNSSLNSSAILIRSQAPTHSNPMLNASDDPFNKTTADLNCFNQSTTDLDGQDVNNTYKWFRNGTIQPNLENETQIAAGNTTKLDVWICEVTPVDEGGIKGVPKNSSNLTILNSPPSVNSALLSSDPSPAIVSSIMNCSVDTPTDLDQDSLQYYYTWELNGANQSTVLGGINSTSIVAGVLGALEGDQVACFITPYDGEDNGTTQYSGFTTIQNSQPTVSSVTLTSDKVQNTTDANFTCTVLGNDDDASDTLNYAFDWYQDDVLTVSSGLIGSNTHELIFGNTSKSEEWLCEGRVHDGTIYSDALNSSVVTIQNTLPVALTVPTILASDSPLNTTTANIIATNGSVQDLDSDSITWVYNWSVNGIVVAQSDTLTFGNTSKGDNVSVCAAPFDGVGYGVEICSVNLTIQNTPPTQGTPIILASDDPLNRTTASLTVYNQSTFDIDSDSVSYPIIRWFRNGTYLAYLDDFVVVTAGNTSKGDLWIAELTPFDGTNFGNPLNSSTITIENTVPVINQVNITSDDSLNRTTGNLECSVGATDVDSDSLFYHYIFYKIATPVFGQSTAATSSFLPASFTAKGEDWTCNVIADDGMGNSTQIYSGFIHIENSIPTHTTPILNTTSALKSTQDNLTAYAQNVIDEDLDPTTTKIQWFKDSIEQTNLENETIVTSGNTTIDEQWIITVTIFDSESQSTSLNSSVLVIGSSVPENITVPGNYTLTENQTCDGLCFNVSVDNVVIDCNNNFVSGDPVFILENVQNITIKNCIFNTSSDLDILNSSVTLENNNIPNSWYLLNSTVSCLNETIYGELTLLESTLSCNYLRFEESYGAIVYDFINMSQDHVSSNIFSTQFNQISVDSVTSPQYNESAQLYFYSVPPVTNTSAQRNGATCNATICTSPIYLGNNVFTFNVTQFTTYSLSNLPPTTTPTTSSGSSSGGGGGGSSGYSRALQIVVGRDTGFTVNSGSKVKFIFESGSQTYTARTVGDVAVFSGGANPFNVYRGFESEIDLDGDGTRDAFMSLTEPPRREITVSIRAYEKPKLKLPFLGSELLAKEKELPLVIEENVQAPLAPTQPRQPKQIEEKSNLNIGSWLIEVSSLLGVLVLAMLVLIAVVSRKHSSTMSSTGFQPSKQYEHDIHAGVDYAQKGLSKGYTKEQIAKSLKGVGWRDDQIEDVFKELESTQK